MLRPGCDSRLKASSELQSRPAIKLLRQAFSGEILWSRMASKLCLLKCRFPYKKKVHAWFCVHEFTSWANLVVLSLLLSRERSKLMAHMMALIAVTCNRLTTCLGQLLRALSKTYAGFDSPGDWLLHPKYRFYKLELCHMFGSWVASPIPVFNQS